MKRKKVTVSLDESTHRWLRAFCKANSVWWARQVTPGKLLAHAALCIADFAGREDGTWRALGAQHILMPAGFQERIPDIVKAKLERRDAP